VVVFAPLPVPSNTGFHLTAAPVGSWATVQRVAQPQVNPDRSVAKRLESNGKKNV